MFPYDPQHQTFLNIYEGEALTQAILGGRHREFEYFAGTRQGACAVVRKFLPAGVHHILIGPDHLLFLVGLLLLGGSIRQLAMIVTAFTVAHSITLSLAALNIVSPPARLIEPAIALSIVYVGADNLLVRDGRDVRAWIAFAFGFIHGFGFANVLREMDLPARALGWSLFSFNVGVEIGQLLVVAGRRVSVVGAALAQRGRGTAPRVRRIGRRHGRRRVLVRPTGVLSWRSLMRRGIVLGVLIAVGALAAAEGAAAGGEAAEGRRSREGQGQPLRAARAAAATPPSSSRPTASPSSTRRTRAGASRSSTRSRS